MNLFWFTRNICSRYEKNSSPSRHTILTCVSQDASLIRWLSKLVIDEIFFFRCYAFPVIIPIIDWL